jgi:biopolymer transport protein ExbD
VKLGRSSGQFERLDMMMTPMIDVCFQMIIFFIANMRLFAPEGDFNIKMPIAAPSEGRPEQGETPPIKVRLVADKKGQLVSIQMGQRVLGSFKELQKQLRDIMGLDRGPTATPLNPEVELDCDYNLRFESVVDALTTISGYLADDKQTVIHLIENIKFSPPRKSG